MEIRINVKSYLKKSKIFPKHKFESRREVLKSL